MIGKLPNSPPARVADRLARAGLAESSSRLSNAAQLRRRCRRQRHLYQVNTGPDQLRGRQQGQDLRDSRLRLRRFSIPAVDCSLPRHAGSIVSGYFCSQGNFRLGARFTCGLVVAGGCGEIYPPVNRMVQAVLPPDTVPFECADAKGGHCVCRVLEVLEDVD